MNFKFKKRSNWIGQEAVNLVLKPVHTSIVSLYVIRFYDISIWGEIIFFLLAAELGTTVINWGQKSHLLRSFSKDISKASESWITAIYARVPILLLAFLLVYLIPQFNDLVIPFMGWLTFKWAIQMFDAYIQFDRKYKWSIIAEFAGIALSLAFLFFTKTMNPTLLVWIFCVSFFVKFIILLPLLPIKKLFRCNKLDGVKALKRSFPFLLLSLVGLVQTKGDLYVSTYFLSVDELAIYQVLIGLLLLGQSLSWVILSPFQKNIFRWHHQSIKKLKRAYLKIGLVVSAITVITIILLIQYIYKIELGKNLFALFFVYLIIMYFYLIESQILIKKGKENELLRFSLYGGVANIGLSCLAIPFLGIKGALLGGIAGKVILAILVVRESKKN